MKFIPLFLLPLVALIGCSSSPESGDTAAATPIIPAAVTPFASSPPPVITTTGATAENATAAPTPTAPAQNGRAETPPATDPAVEPTADPVIAFGRTEEGAYYHGAVDAPVTLIDYSDFL